MFHDSVESLTIHEYIHTKTNRSCKLYDNTYKTNTNTIKLIITSASNQSYNFVDNKYFRVEIFFIVVRVEKFCKSMNEG